jgi:hypothetical protein
MEDEFDKVLEDKQRLKQCEDSIEGHEERLRNLENRFAPLYNIDIDLFFRQFLRLQMYFIRDHAIDDLNQRHDAIIIPSIPPPSIGPDPLGYRKGKLQRQVFKDTSAHIKSSCDIAIGEIKNANDPIKIAHDWYVNEQTYFKNQGISGILEQTAETVFPIPIAEKD